jgi:hypothetical protein
VVEGGTALLLFDYVRGHLGEVYQLLLAVRVPLGEMGSDLRGCLHLESRLGELAKVRSYFRLV